MSSTDRLAAFRERSKSLLDDLRRQQQRKSVQQSGNTPHHTAGGKPADAEGFTEVGNRRPAGTGHSVTFAADLTSSQSTASRSREPNKPPGEIRMSILHDRDMERRPAEVKVTFHSPDEEELTSSESHHYMPPLLGYDWIAGVLDAESSLMERSEEFFDELRTFRSVNKDECVSSRPVRLLEEGPSVQRILMDKDNTERSVDGHQCTFCYRINSRLFPVPLDPRECCPVCRRPKSTIPHTAAQPALVRVSIPRSTLVPAYKYKAHRRRSFDPSDSLGLPSHCLSGWANTGQTTTLEADNLDLRSSLDVNINNDLLLSQAEMDPSLSRGFGCRSGDQTAAVSRLARYTFQHLSPKRKYRSDASFQAY